MNIGANREEMLESVALYALGVLPREEAALVAAFVANDDEARREYIGLRSAADALGHTAEEPVDSARSSRMKERLMSRVRSDAAAEMSLRVARRSKNVPSARAVTTWSSSSLSAMRKPVMPAAASVARSACVGTRRNEPMRMSTLSAPMYSSAGVPPAAA